MGSIIGVIIMCALTIACWIISFFQFKGKGFLFNNAYIYASKKERETMDKKPYYRQSAIVFLLIGIGFMLNVLQLIFEAGWIFWLVIIVVVITIIYAIVSAVVIEKNK